MRSNTCDHLANLFLAFLFSAKLVLLVVNGYCYGILLHAFFFKALDTQVILDQKGVFIELTVSVCFQWP